MSRENSRDRILEAIRDIPVIDTHEHLPGKAAFRDQDTDVLAEYLKHYFSVDLRSSGMTADDFEQAVNPSLPLTRRWKLLEPWWENSRYTGYGRALERSVRILYDLPGINADTIESLNQKFQSTLGDTRIYQSILQTKGHIETAVLDEITGHSRQGDPGVFKEVYRFDYLIRPFYGCADMVENMIGRKVNSLDAWLEAFDVTYTDVFSTDHVIGIKCGLAYERSLYFPSTGRDAAEKAFAEMIRYRADPARWSSSETFENFMMHYMLEKAQQDGRLVQIHTGLQEGNGNMLVNCDPTHLNNLFQIYDNVRFDLFHIGYPFQDKLLALVKMYPQVYADLCWTHIIAPGAVVRFIEDFIDTVPLNKLSAFGGDYLFPDAVIGHLEMAKENVAMALGNCLDRGLFDEETAVETARKFFYYNPKAIFRLPPKA